MSKFKVPNVVKFECHKYICIWVCYNKKYTFERTEKMFIQQVILKLILSLIYNRTYFRAEWANFFCG